jgi:hypothetical protein
MNVPTSHLAQALARRLGAPALLATLLALSCLASAGHAAVTNYPSAKQPITGPESAIERYVWAFRDRSPEDVGGVFTSDYVFHHKGDDLQDYLKGVDRTSEILAVRGMLEGVSKDGAVVLPPPVSVEITADGISQQFDPEHADSTEHYRVLTVKRLEVRLTMPDGQLMITPASLHVMHVVRGDAAVLVEGQPADKGSWYIRRWLNDVSAVQTALRERDGGCGEQEPAPPQGPTTAAGPPPSVPTVLAVRPLLNPACAELSVSCDLPGREPVRIEVYDVSGRLVNRREVQVDRAGTITLEAGKGAHILPGVYWVRLGQASRRPSTQMVVVAR